MARNRYEDALGVTRLRWQQGGPDSHEATLAIVEVWRTTLHAGGHTGIRPEVFVAASIELWAWKDSQCKPERLRRAAVGAPRFRVRRDENALAANAPPSRIWTGRITLDGWGEP